MHVLITSDTVGGVWTYTQELVTGLVRGGHRVTLVSFGRLPLPHQTEWMSLLPALDYRPTEYRLEWMEVAERDIEESRRYLELLVEEVQPDLLHFSQYCYGDIAPGVPRVVVAHSDVVSWWVAVHGAEPDNTPWMRRYRGHVTRGLRAADVVVAPSQWMLDAVTRHYVTPERQMVIHNGRSPHLFNPREEKQDFVLSVGRIWDQAKQTALLLAAETPAQICVVGWEQEPGRETRENVLARKDHLELLGPRSQDELRALFAAASIYAATSRYEPFGLAPLEAAFSGCALVMNDNPVFHELWDDTAVYFQKNDPADLARAIDQLREDSDLRRVCAERSYQRACERFTAERMVQQYETVYQEICSQARVA
jgi:glycosyltransferase involved in cell wall biosynthesis